MNVRATILCGLFGGAIFVAACSGTSGSGTGENTGSSSGAGSSSGSVGGSSGGSSSGGTGSSSGGGSGSGGSGSGGSSSGSSSGSVSGSSSGGSSGSSSGGSSGSSSGGVASAYPPGPYGTKVGDVIANMTWIGYPDPSANVVATTLPYASYSLDDARKSGAHYAMINLAESDCPGCQKSAGEMATGGPSVVQAGGVMIECLETTGFVSQATQSSLQAWVNKYQLTITTVKDPDGTGTATMNALGQREQAYIIDLTTMKIVEIIAGDITGIGATSGGLGMTEMHKLLGK